MTYTFKLARRLAVSRHCAMLFTLLLLAACSGDSTAPDGKPSASPSDIAPLQVFPQSITIGTNHTIQFRGRVQDSTGELVPTPVVWEATGGTIDSTGTFSSTTPGTYHVIARRRWNTPLQVDQPRHASRKEIDAWRRRRQQALHPFLVDTSVVQVLLIVPKLQRIAITPHQVRMKAGAKRNFSVTGFLSNDSAVAVGVAWSATGGAIDGSGTYTAGPTAGAYHVIAVDSTGTLVDTAAIVVKGSSSAPGLAQVVLSPGRRTVIVGSKLQYRAFGRTGAGDSVSIGVAFSATGGTITSRGLFTAGSKPGTYHVIARDSVSRLADTTRVTVALAPTSNPAPGTSPVTPPFPSVPPNTAGGFAAGLTSWPANLYCGGLTSGTMETLTPEVVLGRIQLAAKCGVRLVIVPPRRMLTTNGLAKGVFSVDYAQQLTDRYAAVLPPDTLRKYRGTILGMNLGDDYTCASCWGGRAITQAQVAAWAAYTRTRLPGLPLGVRTIPDWVAAYPALAPLLDYTWAQYHLGKGDARTYYDRAATVAGRLGLRVVMGINVEDCRGGGTAACGAADLLRFGTMAVNHPASCAFLNWRYDQGTWEEPDVRAAWEELLAKARARPAEECRRVGG